MTAPILKYEHIAREYRYKKSYPSRAERPIHNRSILFMNHVKNNSTLTMNDMERMTFNNIALTLTRFTKMYGVKFKKVNADTWDIIGIPKRKIKRKITPYIRVRNGYAHIVK